MAFADRELAQLFKQVDRGLVHQIGNIKLLAVARHPVAAVANCRDFLTAFAKSFGQFGVTLCLLEADRQIDSGGRLGTG